MCDYQERVTTGQTDAGWMNTRQSDPYVPLCFALGSKVMARVKVDNRQTNKQKEQKQYAPIHSIQGYKNFLKV